MKMILFERVSVHVIIFPGIEAGLKYNDRQSRAQEKCKDIEEKATWRRRRRLKISSFKPRNLKGDS